MLVHPSSNFDQFSDSFHIEDNTWSLGTSSTTTSTTTTTTTTTTYRSSSTTTISPKPPRAIVLLLGWWGAKPKNLAKYGEIYEQRGCITVQCIADKLTILTHNNAAMDILAKKVANHIASIIRSWTTDNRDDNDDSNNNKHRKKKIPVLIHSFSNGGAYVLERLEILIEQARQKHPTNTTVHQPFLFNDENTNINDNDRNLLLLGEHIHGQIFDSCPVYPTAKAGIDAAASGVYSNNVVLYTLVAILLTLDESIRNLLNILFGIPTLGQKFFAHMASSQLCLQQVYIYSMNDPITDPYQLEKLINQRKQIVHSTSTTTTTKNSSSIVVQKFMDSPHVQHFRFYPQIYIETIEKAMDHWL